MSCTNCDGVGMVPGLNYTSEPCSVCKPPPEVPGPDEVFLLVDSSGKNTHGETRNPPPDMKCSNGCCNWVRKVKARNG